MIGWSSKLIARRRDGDNIGHMTLVANAPMRAAFVALVAMACGCAPTPKNTPCSNGGDCERIDPRFHYCLQHRCVECIADSSCGERGACVDGACERR
jgi:hypothetical protein